MGEEVLDILNNIQNIRAKNNQNWMDLMRVAFQSNPKDSKKVLTRIVKNDEEISIECKKLLDKSKDEISDEEFKKAKESLKNYYLVIDQTGRWAKIKYFGNWVFKKDILNAGLFTSEEIQEFNLRNSRNEKVFCADNLLVKFDDNSLKIIFKRNNLI